jgi:GTP-binding protein
VARHPPPRASGRPNRLKYITQVKARPPTFVLWASRPADVPDSYRRYLSSGLQSAFGMEGVPVRLDIRASRNPYA